MNAYDLLIQKILHTIYCLIAMRQALLMYFITYAFHCNYSGHKVNKFKITSKLSIIIIISVVFPLVVEFSSETPFYTLI